MKRSYPTDRCSQPCLECLETPVDREQSKAIPEHDREQEESADAHLRCRLQEVPEYQPVTVQVHRRTHTAIGDLLDGHAAGHRTLVGVSPEVDAAFVQALDLARERRVDTLERLHHG